MKDYKIILEKDYSVEKIIDLGDKVDIKKKMDEVWEEVSPTEEGRKIREKIEKRATSWHDYIRGQIFDKEDKDCENPIGRLTISYDIERKCPILNDERLFSPTPQADFI